MKSTKLGGIKCVIKKDDSDLLVEGAVSKAS